MSTSLLIYDIPKRLGVPNPSPRLRRLGFRANGSCWVLRSCDVPWAYLHSLTEKGVREWHVVEFAEGEGNKLALMAVHYLTREVDRLRNSILKSEARMADDPDYARKLRRALRRVENELGDAQRAAEAFGVGLEPDSLREALETFQGLRMRSGVKAQAMSQAVAALETPLAGADGVPAEVVADLLLDQGLDAQADELREAFS